MRTIISKKQTSYIVIVFLFLATNLFAIDPITLLYRASDNGLILLLNESDLHGIEDLKSFLAKDRIVAPKEDDSQYQFAFNMIKRTLDAYAKLGDVESAIATKDLPQLLSEAKIIAKSFLLADDAERPKILSSFIKKEKPNRIFTYEKLKQVIKDKNLDHIKLPRKVLLIKEKRTGEYVSHQLASDIIERELKITARNLFPLKVDINLNDLDKYEVDIFAERINSSGGKFDAITCNQLKQLVISAPFDVGYTNIFKGANGDAIIIDTEYRGEPASSSEEKLKERYCE